MTILVFPKAERPAVNANGTVSPSDSPMVASEINRASILKGLFEELLDELLSECWDSTSIVRESEREFSGDRWSNSLLCSFWPLAGTGVRVSLKKKCFNATRDIVVNGRGLGTPGRRLLDDRDYRVPCLVTTTGAGAGVVT
jgi:hypothetical protein